MRKARAVLFPSLFILALSVLAPVASYSQSESQNREKFVISARAGGVNAVTGRATMRSHGNSEWQLLTIKEDLETGDAVRTGLDGRVEMLLNPGSYMRVGENSEFELADNSLNNLEVRLIKGTAIVEVTGVDDEELFIGITTPHARMSIIRRGLYRVSVVPGNTTELIVRKGRVMLEDSHTKVKGGNKVTFFSSSSFSVAKLTNEEKKDQDVLGAWSKDRAQTLAKANTKISGRTLIASLRSNYPWRDAEGLPVHEAQMLAYLRGSYGLWYYSPGARCYTFVPFYDYWGSPYGGSYSTYFYGGAAWGGNYGRPIFNGGGGGRQGGAGGNSGSGGSAGPSNSPSSSRLPSHTGGSPMSHGRSEPSGRPIVRQP